MSDLFPEDMLGESNRPSREDEAEAQELAILVAQALANGESRESVIADLTNNGWDPAEANEYVTTIEYHLAEARSRQGGAGGGEGMGWLLWIGGLLLFNLLSYLFNWGWMIW